MTPQPLTDSQIHAAFQARSAGSASPDLAERIQSAARATGQQRPLVVLPGGRGIQPQRLLWAAAISATSLALVGGLIFAGRQNDDQAVVPIPVPTEAPSGVPEPTPSAPPAEAPPPSAEPIPSVAPSESPLVVDPGFHSDDGIVTLVDELRVRSEPTVGESSARLEPLLPAGQRLLVIEESVAADGYVWYHVLPFESDYPAGWVAAGSREGESWIAADQTPCPELPLDANERAALGAYGGLVCYGDQEIQLTGDLTCEIADIDRSIGGPSWLTYDHYCSMDPGTSLNPDGSAGAESIMEVLDGGLGLGTSGGGIDDEGFPVTWLGATVTGHFADPESSTCTYGLEEQPAPDPAEVVATCRAMFVATSVE